MNIKLIVKNWKFNLKLKLNEGVSFAVFSIYFADIQFLIQD